MMEKQLERVHGRRHESGVYWGLIGFRVEGTHKYSKYYGV